MAVFLEVDTEVNDGECLREDLSKATLFFFIFARYEVKADGKSHLGSFGTAWVDDSLSSMLSSLSHVAQVTRFGFCLAPTLCLDYQAY